MSRAHTAEAERTAPGKEPAGLRRIRQYALATALALYLVQVGAIVFAPVHVDSGEAGGHLHQLLAHGHTQGWLPEVITYESVERAANVVLFFPGGVLIAMLLPVAARPYLMVGGYAASAVIESIQHMMPHRTADAADVLMNGSGALAGVLVVCAVERIRRKRQGQTGS